MKNWDEIFEGGETTNHFRRVVTINGKEIEFEIVPFRGNLRELYCSLGDGCPIVLGGNNPLADADAIIEWMEAFNA